MTNRNNRRSLEATVGTGHKEVVTEMKKKERSELTRGEEVRGL